MGRLPGSLARLVLILILAAGAACSARADSRQCGPYGDAPATVNRGWFGSRRRPICIGGRVLDEQPWTDSSDQDRYACVYGPKPSREHPLPLVVFLHPSLFNADSILLTGLIEASKETDLGDGPGFVLIAPEGRDTSHYYPWPDANGTGWDNWYRQFDPLGETMEGYHYEENSDAAAIDHFIAEEIATGTIDTRRIYLMGWSNGAAMAILYALNRPNIAAATVYSAPSPFGAFDDPCEQTPVAGLPKDDHEVRVANPGAHIMHLRNACDVAGICPNGNRLASQLNELHTDLADRILDSRLEQVFRCDDTCGTDPNGGKVGVLSSIFGLVHHARWPREWNGRIFTYFRKHPLQSPPPQF